MILKTIIDWPAFLAALCTVLIGCGSEAPGSPLEGLKIIQADASDLPIGGLSAEQHERFLEGDTKFDESARATQGAGPLFIRSRCSACHEADARGPGSVQKFAYVLADGFSPAEQSSLVWGHTVRNQLTAGATTAITAPEGSKVTTRFGPGVFGRGYIEAVDVTAILDGASAQANRDDAIHGRVSYVAWRSQANPLSKTHTYAPGMTGLIGRFGVKARSPSVDDFVADAYQGDMGMTSPMRPDELPNPDELTDDDKPGIDIPLEQVELVADYVRVIDIPQRADADAHGRELFDSVRCGVCHVPTLATRGDYPIAQLAGTEAPIYSDLLLHDMGELLADGLVDEAASSREWRSAPLIGLRFLRNYLHDGRATDVDAAIRGHAGPGSEANDSVERYSGLDDDDRVALLSFVEGL